MDFHNLSRKELQALCKKNMIPANMTNVAMANALAAMDKVEGLDEFINPPKSDPQNSPERTTQISTEPESLQPLTRTRRTTRRAVAGDVTLPETPAVPASRKRAVVGQDKSCLAQTPAVQSSRQQRASAQRKVQEANSTRRSVRLLEKSISKLGLTDKGRVEPIKVDGLSEEVEDVTDENNNVSGAPIAALSPKIEKTYCNEDSLNGKDSCVDNAVETEKPSMHNVLDTAKLSRSVLWEASDSSNPESYQKLEAKDEPRGEYNANAIIHSVATAPSAALSPENKKSLLNSEEDSFGDSSVAIIETVQPSIVNVTGVAPPELSSEGKSNATNDPSENHTEISEDSNATNDEAEVILDLHKEASIIETEQPSIVNLTGVAPPELSGEGKSNATNDLSENHTEISEDSNATTNQAEAILYLHKEEGSDSNPNLADSEYTEISDFSDAANYGLAAAGETPLNYFSIESTMESFVGVSAVEDGELDKTSWDSDRTLKTSETVVDVKEMTEEEEFSAVGRQTSTPSKQTSPRKVSSPNATTDNHGAAGGNIDAPLINSSSTESQMERFDDGVDATEVEEPLSCDSDKTPRTYETCVDVKEMPTEEDFSAAEGIKQASPPCEQQPLAASVSSSPFAQGTLQGQFPRPSQPTAKTTSSAKKLTTILAGINKENIDYGSREVELKREIKEEKPSYDAMSLRMLRKKLKEMQIVNKSQEHAEENSTNKEGKRRMALQMRPENCMHAAADQQPPEKA